MTTSLRALLHGYSMVSKAATDRGPRALLVLSALAACAVIVSRRGYIPLWDGRIYAACVGAAAEALSVGALRCAGHASQAYVLLAALAQKTAPSSSIPMLTVNAALFGLAAVAFHRITRIAFPELPRLDRGLVVSAFTIHPAFLSAVVQPGIDLPLLPGFLWCVVFALEGRWVALALAGIALAFTKETGVLLFAVLLVCYAVWFELRAPRPLGERVARFIRLAPMAVPGVVFVSYLAYRRLAAPSQAVLWHTGTTNDSLLTQFLMPRLDLYQVNYAVLILILNFAWVATAVIVADGFVGLVRAGHHEPPRPVPGAERESLGFLAVLTCAVGYALTRFTTFGHTRYFLVVYALVLLPFVGALLRLGVSVPTRRVVLGCYAMALLASTVRTVDPVSRRIYGTFAFGSHEMLRMTRITGECCGFGQDQLAYSVEFTTLQPLVDLALAAMDSSASRPILVVPDSTSWIFLDPISAGRRRFLRWGSHRHKPALLEHREVVKSRQRLDSAFYIALPYGDNARAMREMAPLYEFRDERRFESGGYALPLYRIVSRPAVNQ